MLLRLPPGLPPEAARAAREDLGGRDVDAGVEARLAAPEPDTIDAVGCCIVGVGSGGMLAKLG
jgi:hypothetical protein